MRYPVTKLPQSSDIRYARSQVAAASAYAPVRDADVHPEELGGLGMEGRADFGEKMLHDAELDANEYGVAEALCQLRHVCRRKGIDIVDVMRASLAQYERDLEIG